MTINAAFLAQRSVPDALKIRFTRSAVHISKFAAEDSGKPRPVTPEWFTTVFQVSDKITYLIKKCLGGTWKTATCNEGLVHVGTSGNPNLHDF